MSMHPKNRIKSWLSKPFPFYETFKQKITIPLLFAFFIMFFLVMFNPSHNTDFVSKQFFKVFFYGFITFFAMSFCNIVLPFIFPKMFNLEKWNVQKTILFALLTIISIALFNALFAFSFDNSANNNQFFPFLIAVSIKTLTVGLIPSLLFVFYREKSLYKKNGQSALNALETLKYLKNKQLNDSEETIILSPNAKKNIEIAYKDLYCIKSEGNYCTYFFKKDNSIEKMMIRGSLSKIQQSFLNSENIIRCHKSYIINLDKVNDIKGNARGYFFFINDLNLNIPGSRNLSKSFIDEIINS